MIALDERQDERTLHQQMRETCGEIDAFLEQLLADPGDMRRPLYAAMRYAAIGGGKRLRPLLVKASCELFGVKPAHALRAAAAAECVHVQSLIHDDLPCMDDDDLRRGKPTLHLAFDEATATLAGDALLALAFEVLADPATHRDGALRAQLVAGLARAAGPAGMAGGQMLDLLPGPHLADVHQVTVLQQLKTGALIAWCLDVGTILGEAPPPYRQSLHGYAHCLGLAFQIADDLLDENGDQQLAGKRLGKDRSKGKVTFADVLGCAQAERYAELLVIRACQHLDIFGGKAALLRELAEFAIRRDH